METEHLTQTLNSQQLEQALAILRREQQANTPSPLQKKIFKLLAAPIYGFAVVIGGFLFAIFIAAFVSLFTGKNFFHGGFVGGWGGIGFSAFEAYLIALVLLTAIYGCLSGIGILVLISLNRSYLRELRRQNKLIKSLGLKEAIEVPWKRRRQKKRPQDIVFLSGSILGLITMLSLFLGAIYELSGEKFLNDDFFGAALLSILSIFAMVAIVVTNLARRHKVRLGLISGLHSSLEEQLSQNGKDYASGISISKEDYQKIAQIERSQISRGRIKSIMAGLEESDASPYVIQKSREARKVQDSFDDATCLRVQEHLDALTAEPHPPGVEEDSKSGSWKMPVPNTPVIVKYTVDDDSRRVRILSLETASEVSGSPSEHGGSRHV